MADAWAAFKEFKETQIDTGKHSSAMNATNHRRHDRSWIEQIAANSENLREEIRAYLDRLEAGTGPDLRAAIKEERATHNNIVAEYNEAVAQITAGVLVRNYEIRRAITDKAVSAKGKLTSLPPRIARIVTAQRDREHIAEIVRGPITEAIEELRPLEKHEFRQPDVLTEPEPD
jgi:hypothetical protein